LQEPRGTTKICCAFANSFGGFLVIGVGEKKSTGFKIEGIEPNKELYGQLLAKIRAEPTITVCPPKTIAVAGSTKLVYIFEVPRSPRRPHLPMPVDERVFWKRVGSDCVQMTLEEVRYQMNNYEEKREKLTLLLMELHHIVRSLNEQASVQDRAYTGTMFSFDIIDRVIVESYAILRIDFRTIGVLDNLKHQLMLLNFEKQKLLSMLSMSYSAEDKTNLLIEYRNLVTRVLPGVAMIAEQIERSFKEKFEIECPYKL